MTGYQEILTDPSYCEQIITFTAAHIGNVGTNKEDNESKCVWAAGMILSNLPSYCSNWRNEENFHDFLIRHGVIGIAGVDTRQLTRHIRDYGALRACIMSENINADAVIQLAKNASYANKMVQKVSTKKINKLSSNKIIPIDFNQSFHPHVVVVDLGVKESILQKLCLLGCKITLVPHNTLLEVILSLQPDGIVLSNGPGDPQELNHVITLTKKILELNIPIFGICLGCQLLALASGAQTFKMKYGHHGANHPVIDVNSKKIFITSQNHGYAINETTLSDEIEVTHRSLFDNTIQGIQFKEKNAFGFQGHPEGHPGPEDIDILFKNFIAIVAKGNSCREIKVSEMF
jgi:carbamoyl-phosphate synthase small subunit